MTCPVFLGRSDELRALNEARRGLARSRGRVVLIGGEAGVGKSRLLGQFMGAIARDSRPRYFASAECIERAERPFGPFRDLVAALGGSFAGLSGAQLDKTAIFAGVANFFRDLAAKRATVLTIEDLHWSDRSSLELLAYLAAHVEGTRLLIVATYRSEDVESREPLFDALSRLSREPTVERIAVEAFDASQTRELIERALDGHPEIPDLAREDVVRRSEGNPFFAEELLKAASQARAGQPVKLPISIRATIASRLEMLGPHERNVVAHAAVLGYYFEPELLALTMGCALDDVLPVLRRGRDLNIFAEEAGERVRFRFRHPLMREVSYEGMMVFDARRTHERILRVLESAPDANRHTDALAFHAWSARDRARSLRYNERAGEEALELRALPEARVFFERALEAARVPEDEARLCARLALVLEMHGAIAEAVERYETAFVRYRDLGDWDRATDVVRALATNRNNLGFVDAVAPGNAFLETHGDRVSIGPRDALLALLARLSTIRYDKAGAERFLARIEAPGELAPRALQNVLIARMDIALFAGDADAWRSNVPPLFEAVAAMQPFPALSALYSVAQTATWFGLGEIADAALARADRIEARWEFGAVTVYGAAVRAMYAYYTGRLAAAREEIVRALRSTEAGIARMAVALVAPFVAVALAEPDLVPALMEEELAEMRRHAETPDDALVLAAAAHLAIHRGDVKSAREDLRVALRCTPRVLCSSATVLGLAAQHLPEEELAPLYEILALPLLPNDVAGRAHAALAGAILELRFGDAARARVRASEAVAGYRRLGQPMFEAWALDVSGDETAARALRARCGVVAGEQRPVSHAVGVGSGGVKLSTREAAVARAIARGETNAQIADGLSISVRTVEKHVAAIFGKLGLRSRSQVAAAFARE
jgi:DNA-binding CsgD family transcriptional regulator/tetratricopeptide (TPR) repeat protein